jgi:hypothetical protein
MSVAQPLPISPGATLDISWDWTAWLAAGETISARTVSVVAPLTKGADSVAAGIVTAMVTAPAVSAAPLGLSLTARCTITTSEGRTDTRRFSLMLTDR